MSCACYVFEGIVKKLINEWLSGLVLGFLSLVLGSLVVP